MKKIKKLWEENQSSYLAIGFITFLFLSLFLANRYAQDTYYLEAYGYVNNALHPYLHDGRLLMTAFLYLCHFLKIPFAMEKMISWFLAFISIFLGTILVFHRLKKCTKHKVLPILLSFLSVFSPFVLELLMFPELSGISCLGLFLCISSGLELITCMETKKTKHFIFALILALIGAFSYQGVFSLLIIIPLPFVWKYSNNLKSFILNHIRIASVYMVSCLTTLITTKILKATRTITTFEPLDSLIKILDGTKDLLIDSGRIYPKYFLLGSIIVLIVIGCLKIRKNKNQIKNFLYFFYLLFATIIITIAPHIMINQDYIWMVPRSNIGLGLLTVIPLIYMLLYCENSAKNQKFLSVLLIIFLSFLWIGSARFSFSQLKNNAIDEEYANQIQYEITKKEQEGLQINKIEIYQDQEILYTNNKVWAKDNMNTRTFSSLWAAQSILSWTTKKEVIIGNANHEFAAFCHQKNWNNFDKEQLHLENDTLYVCIY